MFGCATLGGLLYLFGDLANNLVWSKASSATSGSRSGSAQPQKKAGKSKKMRVD